MRSGRPRSRGCAGRRWWSPPARGPWLPALGRWRPCRRSSPRRRRSLRRPSAASRAGPTAVEGRPSAIGYARRAVRVGAPRLASTTPFIFESAVVAQRDTVGLGPGSLAEEIANCREEVIQGQRLRQGARSAEGCRRLEHVEMSLLAPTGHGDDLRLPSVGPQVTNELQAVPLGHVDVQHDDVGPALTVQAQAGRAVGRYEHFVPGLFESPADGATEIRIVINYQNARARRSGTSLRPWRVEHFAHLSRQAVRRERLLQIRDARLEDAVPHDGIVRIPGHEEHPHFRPQLGQPVCQLAPAQPGHDYIGYEQANRSLVLLGDAERRCDVRHLEDGVPLTLEHLAGDDPYRRRVLDEQNRFCSAGERWRRAPQRQWLRGLVHPREVDLEGRATPRLRVHPDEPPRLLDDPIDP